MPGRHPVSAQSALCGAWQRDPEGPRVGGGVSQATPGARGDLWTTGLVALGGLSLITRAPQGGTPGLAPVTLSSLGVRKPQLAVDNFLSPGGSGNWGPVTGEGVGGGWGPLSSAYHPMSCVQSSEAVDG